MCNVFSYCGNNPVSNSDPEGTFFKKIVHFLKSTWKKTKKAVAKVYNFVRENVATFVGTESYQTSKVEEVFVVTGYSNPAAAYRRVILLTTQKW